VRPNFDDLSFELETLNVAQFPKNNAKEIELMQIGTESKDYYIESKNERGAPRWKRNEHVICLGGKRGHNVPLKGYHT